MAEFMFLATLSNAAIRRDSDAKLAAICKELIEFWTFRFCTGHGYAIRWRPDVRLVPDSRNGTGIIDSGTRAVTTLR